MSTNTNGPARERIQSLLDAGSFVEIGAAVTARCTDFNMGEKKAASDGVVTGYGQIEGRPVYVYSQDPSVLGGTVGEMHAAKIVNLYNLALKTGDPIIGLIECAGMRLEEGMDCLHAFGKIYMAQTAASGVIPQITAVFGMCGGGMALVPALSDFVFMEKTKGKMFFSSPNALTGNTEESCDTASSDWQGREAGTVDFAGSAEEITASVRDLITNLPSNNEDDMSAAEAFTDPNLVLDDLAACVDDPAIMLARISDDGFVFESRPFCAEDMVTALIRLNGYTVGVIANRHILYDAEGAVSKEFSMTISADGARKAARFVNFCDAFSVPVVTLTNVSGFAADKDNEKRLADEVSRLTYAFANANTPKVNLITGSAYGSSYLVMNSKSVGADIVFAWEGAKIGMMDSRSAARILCPGGTMQEVTETADTYEELQNSAASAAARGYVDTVIAPSETRKYLIGALDMLFTKRELRPDKKHGSV